MSRLRDIYERGERYLAFKPPADDATWLHECEDGHRWQEHANGTVSPSYGHGGTELTWPGHDPKTCPEPERRWSIYTDADGQECGPDHGIKCPTCGSVFYCGHCPGPDGDVRTWDEPVCEAPRPICLKPIFWSARWTPVKRLLHREAKGGVRERYEGWTHTWVPVDIETGSARVEDVREPTLF